MDALTSRQRQVLEFIRTYTNAHGIAPTLREIAEHFHFRSPTAAGDHVRALRRKKYLTHKPGSSRAHGITSPHVQMRALIVDVPIYDAGSAQPLESGSKTKLVSVDTTTLGVSPTAQTYAIQMRGDSMMGGSHILDGDIVILDLGLAPRPGDIVAVVVNNETTLKTYTLDPGKPVLPTESPKLPGAIPASSVQGVMVGLIRRAKRPISPKT